MSDYGQGPQEPRKPTHSLAKWRENHSFQRQPVAITLGDRIRDLESRIAAAEKFERVYRQTGQIGKADAQLRKLGNLRVQLEDLQAQAQRVPLDAPIDEEVE